MARALRFADRALDDVSGMRRWLTQPGSGTAARRKLRSILSTIRQLRRTPCLHARGEHPGTRTVTVHGYTVVYRLNPDTGDSRTAGDVLVLRIFGPGQSREVL
jgi:plasmid stabilization system protein ParE